MTKWVVLTLLIILAAVSTSYAAASSVVVLKVTITDFDVREDGAELTKAEVKAFRVFKVGESGLEALTPDISYDKVSDEVTSNVQMVVTTPTGDADICAMTIDTYDQISTVCSDVVQVPFTVAPPGAPGTITVTHAASVTLSISPTN